MENIIFYDELEITLDEAKQFLRIDFDYDDLFIKSLIEIARIYIDSCVGEAYKTVEKKYKLSNILMQKIISDMYSERSTQVDSSTKRDIIFDTILDSLSLTEEIG